MKPVLPTAVDRPEVQLRMRGRKPLNLVDPSPLDIEPLDFVYGTSRTARWGGQTMGEIAYSVAQHQCLADDIAVAFVLKPPHWSPGSWEYAVCRRRVLTHDLHEGGGLGDLLSPYTRLLDMDGGKVSELKFRLDRALFLALGVEHANHDTRVEEKIKAAVKTADRIAAVSEAIQLMGYAESEARLRFGAQSGAYKGPIWTAPIVVLDERAARAAWIERARELGLRIDAHARDAAPAA